MLFRKIRSQWLFYTSVASGGVLWDKTWRGANFYLSWACLLVCIASFPLCQNDWQEREWRTSDPNIAGDGFMQKLNSVCKFLWFVLSSGFFRKKHQTNQPCFAGAIYLGGSSSGLVTIVASFAVVFGLGWDLMAGQGVRGGRSFSEAPSGRNLHSSNLRWGSDVLFSSLRNKLLSRHVVVNAHLGNLHFLETYQVGFCDGHCTSLHMAVASLGA